MKAYVRSLFDEPSPRRIGARSRSSISAYVCVIFVVVASASSGCSNDIEGAIANSEVRLKRGVGFWPLDFSPDYLDECFKLLEDGSDLVIAQRSVFETRQNRKLHRVYDEWLDRGAAAGLKKYIALDIFDEQRRALQKPEGWVGNAPLFSDSRIRRAFEVEVLEIVKRHRPTYLNLGVEANMYYAYNPDDYEHFRSLFQSVREEIKAVSPDTKVFVSFQYEVLRGAAPFLPTEPQWRCLELWLSSKTFSAFHPIQSFLFRRICPSRFRWTTTKS